MERQQLLQQVETLIDQTQGVDFVVPEETGYFSIDDVLVRRVRALIEETIEVMHDLTEVYDAESVAHGEKDEAAAADGDFLREIGAQISSELAAREVSNLAFVARGQLKEMQEALHSALDNKQVWAVASHADSGLRRAGKALIAIETAVRDYEGLPARDRRWNDLGDSLETRRLYAQFRRAILRSGERDASEDVASRLRSAATRIAILRNLEIYPFLRIDDRRTIKMLHQRIAAWLNREGDNSQEAGERLWQDLISFARLLLKVNHREELCEHDRQVINSLHRMLFPAKRPVTELKESHLKELERIVGRDDELDELVLRIKELTVEDLRASIERLKSQLNAPYESGVVTSFLDD
ncbi:MAG: hypothetical protein AAF657_01925 [Acidobacteriota bacterium]